MASTPYEDRASTYDSRDAAAPRERSLGEHVFIWIAWALAAAFWGASLTIFGGILRDVGQPTATPVAAVGAPGGMGFLALAVAAFLVLAVALAYGSLRTALGRSRRLDAAGEAGTAALYDTLERQGGEDMTSRSPDRARAERDFH